LIIVERVEADIKMGRNVMRIEGWLRGYCLKETNFRHYSRWNAVSSLNIGPMRTNVRVRNGQIFQSKSDMTILIFQDKTTSVSL
jgi:hypothetical protein